MFICLLILTSTLLTLIFTFKENSSAIVEVLSLNGALIKTERIKGSSQIDLTQLKKGNYVLKVVSGKSNYAVKFVKE
ncbi:MAG: T9SS type A sorting domain-containing protein [Paludibacter sp.]